MENRGYVTGLAVVFLLVGQPIVSAQAVEDRQVVSALLDEVRLLRRTLEKQVPLQARAQLLIGRLALQDQRVARSRTAAQRAESERDGLTGEVLQVRHQLARLQAERERAEPAHHAALDAEIERLPRMIRDLEGKLAVVDARRSQAGEQVAQEEARYEELERWFVELERELSRGVF